MTLDDLGNVAEIVSAVAVLATLIYLSVQIRQNRQVLSSQTLLVAMQNFNDINQGIVEDADVARIWDSGSTDPDALSPGDTTRFFMLARQVLNAYMSLFWLYRDGVLSEARWKGLGFDVIVNLPGMRRFFDAQAPTMEDEFVRYVRSTSVVGQWDGVAFSVKRGREGGV